MRRRAETLVPPLPRTAGAGQTNVERGTIVAVLEVADETRRTEDLATMRIHPILLLAAISLVLPACNHERIAREELAKDGFVDLDLKPADAGGFDFTGTRGAQHCSGTITVQRSFGTTSTTKSERCGVDHSCSEKTPGVCREQAEAFEKAGEYDKARDAYGKGCDFGHGPSCNDLGVDYGHGEGTPKDLAKAIVFYEKACALKDALGCENAGFVRTRTEPPTLDLSFAAFKKGCDLGSSKSCYELGRCYMNGTGVPAEPAAGLAAFDKSCKAGVQQGCGAYGLFDLLGKGMAADVPRGAKMLSESCDAGNAEACKNLGILVRDGQAPPKDPKRAVALFEKACAGKDAGGCNELGLALERGQGAPRDLEEGGRALRAGLRSR